MKNLKFTGILPALVTPFEADGKTVSIPTTERLVELFLKQGAEGFYVLGGTGEGLIMDRHEREVMCEAAVQSVNGRKPVICHVAAIQMEETIALAKHAERVGANAVAAIPPVFFHYDAEDIYNYYKAIADNVHIPVIIYYHPAAQGAMSADLIAKIYEIDNVTGVKWSSTDLYQMMRLKDKTHGEMNIINGPDELLVSGLAAGADAGIGSTYNIMLPEFVRIYNAFKAGRMDEALKTQMRINAVIGVMLEHELIPSVKYALKLMGCDVGEAMHPMKYLTDEQKAQVEAELKRCGWPFADTDA